MQGRLSASAILYRRLLAGSSLRREERARRCRRFCWGRALARLFVFASAFRFLATRHRPSQSMVRHVAKGLPPSMMASALSRDTWTVRAAGLVFFFLPERIFSLSCISTKARFVNPAVESGSTNHLFGYPRKGTMILSSDAAIARGSKAPNQPSDGLASTRVAPGLPCLRTSWGYAAPLRSIQYIRTANLRAI